MNTVLKSTLIQAALVLGGLLLNPANAATPTLDGKTYSGDIAEAGKKKGDPDDFVFKDGQFVSTACQSLGFGPASYTATAEGEAIRFEATSKAGKGAAMQWKGLVRGGTLDATALWVRPGKKTAEYHATGSLKN